MSDTTFTIRTAKFEDLQQIKEIDAYIFEEDSYPLFVLRQLLDITKGMMKVATVADEVVGYAIGHVEMASGEAWLLSAGVLPHFRGRSIGLNLLKGLVEDMTSKGAKFILLTVQPKNAAGISLYQKLGFSTFQTSDNYYLDNARRLLMRKELS